MPGNLSIPGNFDIQQLLETYVLPWGINIVMALAIFLIGKSAIKISEDDRILTDPAPTIAVAELADSSVNFNVRPWCNTADYWDVYGDIHEKIKLTFDAEGISIPYPPMDVHQDKAA